MKKPIITVKNVKHIEALSTDSLCFSATVYVDGKRFAIAKDNGYGGEIDIEPLDWNKREGFEDSVRKLQNLIKDTYPVNVMEKLKDPETGKPMEYDETLEALVNDAVVVFLGQRDFKRSLKKTLFINSEGMFNLNKKHDERGTKWVMDKYPEAIVLNDLPFDEGFKAFIDHGK